MTPAIIRLTGDPQVPFPPPALTIYLVFCYVLDKPQLRWVLSTQPALWSALCTVPAHSFTDWNLYTYKNLRKGKYGPKMLRPKHISEMIKIRPPAAESYIIQLNA